MPGCLIRGYRAGADHTAEPQNGIPEMGIRVNARESLVRSATQSGGRVGSLFSAMDYLLFSPGFRFRLRFILGHDSGLGFIPQALNLFHRFLVFFSLLSTGKA